MRRLLAFTCVGLLAFSAPALAQSTQTSIQSYGASGQGNGAGPQSYGAGDQGQAANGQSTSGTDAFAQVSPPGFGDMTSLLVIGGIAGGAGLIAYAVSQNQGNSNPVSP